MKVAIALLLVLLLFTANACGVFPSTQCDNLADTIHDVSLFLCSLSADRSTSLAPQQGSLSLIIDTYTNLLLQAQPSLHRDNLLERLACEKAKLSEAL